MRKIFKNSFLLAFIAVSTFFTSCSSDDNSMIQGPSDNTTHNLLVTPTNSNNTSERNLTITSTPNTPVKVNVKFTSSENMYRLYITKNVLGGSEGPVPFVYSQVVDTKSDGSIDLGSGDKKEFVFNIDFDAPTTINETVQYVLWVTTGRGDFRDITKRNAIAADAYGTISIKGSSNADTTINGVKSFSQVLLAAPLADGSSKTFLSLFDNKVYAINQGVEFAAFWDFGYYYGNTNKASFASASNYPTDIVNIPSIGGTTELNKFYFKKSSKTTTDFDAISTKADLDFITQPTTERVTNLLENDIIEFVDAYGNKGLIKIVKITGTDGSDGSIKFDVKVQINAEPIKA